MNDDKFKLLIDEQAALIRECSAAIDELLIKKPGLAGVLCGSTTLGNLRVELHTKCQGLIQ